MDLYFAPLACSMATRIALYEADADANYLYVDIHTHPHDRRLEDGSDYFTINPMGQVPAVRTAEGELITENPVVLQYVADRYPESGLAPQGGLARYRLQEWLNFIGTELHKGMYIPLLGHSNPEGAKDFARQKTAARLGHVESRLQRHEFLLDFFTVADAYLFTVLNWSQYAGVDLSPWPALQAYYQRLLQRPSIAKALAEEGRTYAWELKRKEAA